MIYKVFIFNNKATFICPECEKVKTIDARPYLHSKARMRVNCKCPCGHSFKAIMERRNYLRKDITLPGVYCRFMDGQEIEKGQIVVLDLSRGGLKFKPHVPPAFQIGDQLHVIFNLNDRKKSLIKKKATIKNINQKMLVVMEFCRREPYGRIGSFLFG